MQKLSIYAATLALATSVYFAPAFAADQSQRQQRSQQEIDNAPVSATIEFEAEQIRLIVGGGSGKGTLSYQGKTYPFTFKGASVGGVGVTKAQGTGVVKFMNKLEDFAGTYTAVGAGATAVKGGTASSFENDKGVYISVRSKTEGLALSLGITSAKVELTK